VDGLNPAGALAGRRAATRRATAGRRPRLKPGPLLRWVAALLWFVVTVLPIWWMFNVVFTAGGVPVALNPRLYPSSIPAGIENVTYILTQTPMLHSFLVSFTYAFFQILGMLVVVPMAAYEFALFKFPGKNALFLIALSALMVPGAVTLIPLYKIVAALGWLNTLQGLAVPWMASPFALFVFKQFMESVPRELLDAAEIDGASHFQTYSLVALPLSMNAAVTLSVITFMFSWGNFIWPLVISNKPDWYTVSITVSQFFAPSSHATIEVVMSAAFLAALPPILFYAFLQRYIIQGIALTGMKA
jgi:multiple sugar transport system permease protein